VTGRAPFVAAPLLGIGSATRVQIADHAIVLGIGAALAYGALNQGAFYSHQFTTVLWLVGAAGLARAVVWRRPVPVAIAVAAVALAAFAGWTLLRAAATGDVSTGFPAAGVACCLAVAAVAVTGTSVESRRVLVVVVLAVAVVVAASSWLGVALHAEPLALQSSGLWRGSSTLTYANTTAALLVIALLVAVGAMPDGLVRTAVVAVLLLGLLSTMSRAGGVGVVVAFGVLVALRKARLRSLMPVVPAVAVAGAALLPSLPVGDPAAPMPAVLGVVGGALVLLLCRRMRPVHLGVGLLAAAVVALAVIAVVPTARQATAGIVATRFTAESYERADLTRVTSAQFRTAPVTGIGPGHLNLRYIDYTGRPVRAVYTHDEYLQTATETGLVGLAAALAALAAFTVGGFRRRRAEGAVVVAAVAGFAAHSAFDFLWHVPEVPLLLAVAAAVLITGTTDPRREETSTS
jgi:hypothetical protein